MTPSQRQHTAAAAATLLFHALLLCVLCAVYLRYNPAAEAERTWPPADSSEVLLAGEYVMMADGAEAETAEVPEPETTSPPAMPAPEDAPAASPDPAPAQSPQLTSQQTSPAKAQPNAAKKAHGPTKAEREAAARKRKMEEEERARQAIAKRVNFGKSGAGSGTADKGSPEGNAPSGASSGKPGFNLRGRTIASWETPPSAPVGTITVTVTVNRQGEVTDAAYLSGSGAAAASTPARAACIRAAKASKFSVDLNAAASQKGTITYHFK